ncbi:MAG: hypothetical protein SNJ52_05310, partial [Verrucomicrobiia bacterium]
TEQLLKKAEQVLPDDPLLRQAWATHRARLGFHEEAMETFAGLAQQFPEKTEFVALAVQAAIDAKTPQRALALLGTRIDPATVGGAARELSRLHIEDHNLDQARLLRRHLLQSPQGGDLPPLIVAFGKAGRLAEAASLAHWARRAMPDPAVGFQLETALLTATLAAQGSDDQVTWQIRRMADAAATWDGPGELNHFLSLIDIAAEYPACEAVHKEILRLAENRPAQLPLERALALWIGRGWQKESTRLIALIAEEPRISENTLLFAVAGLIENKRQQDALRLAETLNRRYPLSVSNHLLLALAAADSDNTKAEQALQNAAALAAFDPDAMARVGLFHAEQHQWQRASEAFGQWTGLTLPRNATFRAMSVVAAIHTSQTRTEAAEHVRRFYEESQTLPDVLPLLTFHTLHGAGTNLEDLCQKLDISPIWATQAALVGIQKRVQEGDLRGALHLLISHPRVLSAPNAPIGEMDRLIASRLGTPLIPLLMSHTASGTAPQRLVELLEKAKLTSP